MNRRQEAIITGAMSIRFKNEYIICFHQFHENPVYRTESVRASYHVSAISHVSSIYKIA